MLLPSPLPKKKKAVERFQRIFVAISASVSFQNLSIQQTEKVVDDKMMTSSFPPETLKNSRKYPWVK
jgi:hypothetical protein